MTLEEELTAEISNDPPKIDSDFGCVIMEGKDSNQLTVFN